MKIVQIDNFGRDHVADILIAEKVNKFFGGLMVKLLNERFSSDTSNAYYVLKEDDYKLNTGMDL